MSAFNKSQCAALADLVDSVGEELIEDVNMLSESTGHNLTDAGLLQRRLCALRVESTLRFAHAAAKKLAQEILAIETPAKP